ncbi:MAG TPA: response regulator, partial [Polyangia bacterium]|nr:response regulator [Polyangia bacterium]
MPAPQNAAAVGGGLRVLIVDDEKNIRTTLTVCLEGMGAEALAGESGLDLLPKLLALEPGLAIVLITAYGTIETAVEAIRRGAWDYLAKPFTPAQIRHQVEKLRTERDLTKRVAELERRLAEEAPDVEITSRSPAMRGVLDMAARVAATDA